MINDGLVNGRLNMNMYEYDVNELKIELPILKKKTAILINEVVD